MFLCFLNSRFIHFYEYLNFFEASCFLELNLYIKSYIVCKCDHYACNGRNKKMNDCVDSLDALQEKSIMNSHKRKENTLH